MIVSVGPYGVGSKWAHNVTNIVNPENGLNGSNFLLKVHE